MRRRQPNIITKWRRSPIKMRVSKQRKKHIMKAQHLLLRELEFICDKIYLHQHTKQNKNYLWEKINTIQQIFKGFL